MRRLEGAAGALWQVPARRVAVFHRGVRPFLDVDVRLFERAGVPPLAAAAAVIAIVVPSAVGHLINTNEFLAVTNNPFRVLIRDVFTESIPYMAAAVAIGLVAPTLGVLFVVAHVAVDLPVALLSPNELSPLPMALVGRAVSWWLLWLLAVEIPSTARSVAPRVSAALTARPEVQLPAAAAAAGLAAGVLAWVWTQAVIILIRPVFTWTDQGSPSYEAIAPAQETGVVIAFAAVLVCAGAAWVHLRTDPLAGVSLFAEQPSPPREVPRLVGDVAAAVLLTVVLGGVITGALDIAILFTALLAARPIARWAHGRLGVARVLGVVPWLIRYIAGFLVTYAIGLIVIPPLFHVFIGTEFLPLVITIALGSVVFEILLAEPMDAPVAPRRVGGGTATAILVLAGIGFLAMPAVAYADNCSGRFDCYPAPFAAAGGAAAAAAAAAARRGRGSPRPPDKRPLEQARDATGLIGKLPGGQGIPKYLIGKGLGAAFDAAGNISRSLGGDPPRADFRVVEVAAPISLSPELLDTGDLSTELSHSLHRIIAAHAVAIASGRAAIVSFDRYGGARAAGDRYWTARQAVAVITHKKAWASALGDAADGMDAYLASLAAIGIHSDILTVDEARAEQERLRIHGLDADDVRWHRLFGATDEEIESNLQARLSMPADRIAGDQIPRLASVATAYRSVAAATAALPIPPDPEPAPDVPAAA